MYDYLTHWDRHNKVLDDLVRNGLVTNNDIKSQIFSNDLKAITNILISYGLKPITGLKLNHDNLVQV